MKERTEGRERERDRQTDGRTDGQKERKKIVHQSIIVPRVFHVPVAEATTGNKVDSTCCYNSNWPEKLMVTLRVPRLFYYTRRFASFFHAS